MPGIDCDLPPFEHRSELLSSELEEEEHHTEKKNAF